MHLPLQGCALSSEDGQTRVHKTFWSTAYTTLLGAGEGGQLGVSRSQQRLELSSSHGILPAQNFLFIQISKREISDFFIKWNTARNKTKVSLLEKESSCGVFFYV